jgi:hypothetical protein
MADGDDEPRMRQSMGGAGSRAGLDDDDVEVSSEVGRLRMPVCCESSADAYKRY